MRSRQCLIISEIVQIDYSASGIAESKLMETGFAVWKLGKTFYIIPFVFAYTGLLFEGSAHETLVAAIRATPGRLVLTATMEGYFVHRLVLWKRGFDRLSHHRNALDVLQTPRLWF